MLLIKISLHRGALLACKIDLIRVVPGRPDLREDSGLDAHRHELLEKQLARIWNLNLADLWFPTNAHGRTALVGHLLQVGLSRHAAPLADVDAILI